jgi:hypothetical protein
MESNPSPSYLSLLPQAKPLTDPVCAVIVTVVDGNSYDPLFRSVPQSSPNGRIPVYQLHPSGFPYVIAQLKDRRTTRTDNTQEDVLAQLIKDIDSVESSSVVFNWECCSSWACKSFKQFKNDTFQLMQTVLEGGYMIMYSDFALKALIQEWDTSALGPNPFKNCGEFGGNFTIRFISSELAQCPSAQLQRVAELCEEGTVQVHAMGSTIIFSVDNAKTDTSRYQLKVLTVANIPERHSSDCRVGDYTGFAGHVLLTYPKGGKLLVSCGHWIELSRVGVSEQKLYEVAEREMGTAYVEQMKQEISLMDEGSRQSRWESEAKQYVQQSAPCAYTVSSSKGKW